MITQYLFLIFCVFSFVIFLYSLHQTKNKSNSFGETLFLSPLGIFVWADGVIIGLFWTLVPIITFLLQDWLLFFFIFSLFWLVRSFGETIYWLNQQFSPINRNSPKNLRGHTIFHNDSIWFVYQIFWQCLTVVSLIFSIYLGTIWLITKL